MNRWAPLFTALLGGCAAHATVTSVPAGAQLVLPDGATVVTPARVAMRPWPLARPEVVARAPGYRDLRIALHRGDVELLMVPDHEAVGAWTVEDVP